MNCKTNGGQLRASVTMLLAMIILLTASCTEYSKVSRSDWDSASSSGPADWKVETSTTIYRVQRFTTTDSTVVITDASRAERVGGASYPANPTMAIKNSELPIVLRIDDVASIERGQFSRGRTVAAVLGIAATTCVAALVVFWLYAESHGGLY